MPFSLTAALCIVSFFGCGLSLVFPPGQSPAVHEDEAPAPGQPMMITLRRESVPVKRQGKVVSFKTSYSGIIGVGAPVPQPFRVVFDTGSGHVVVPAATCESDACLVHQRFNMSASETAVPINADGTAVPDGELCDQVDIGFGTGQITGEFVRDKVCLGVDGDNQENTCLEMNVVMAVKMSTQPFKSFNFDGIMGLGLSSLALSDDFSFFDLVSKSGRVRSAHFGVFLTEGDVEGEESEIAIGGYNEDRLMHPLAWSPVAMADFGYWQVRILAVRVDGVELDVCKDGTCRGVVDTGTSHLGIPAPHDREVASLLTVDAGDLLDCRLAQTPVMEIQLETINITLSAENYMRRLPLREGVNVGSATGVVLPANDSHAAASVTSEPTPLLDENETAVTRHCRPRLMPVNLPEPVGPKLFILGEPVLHRYYTVYDWKGLQVGFSLANNARNNALPGSQVGDMGALPSEVEKLLMQQSVVPNFGRQDQCRQDRLQDELEDGVAFVQLKMRMNVRRKA